jgi:putative transposase
MGEQDAGRWLDLSEWRMEYSPEQWREVLRTTVAEEAEAERIREATRTGRPLGEEGFLREMERRLQRRLTPGKPGRPARKALADEVRLCWAEEIGK